MQFVTLGIDIGKTWFHVVGLDSAGKPVLREKFNRQRLMRFIGTCPTCLIGMEACPGSQYLARRFEAAGHQVKLVAPRFVKAFLKSNKNDLNDAAAIAEAVLRPTMRFVAIRSIEQIDLQGSTSDSRASGQGSHGSDQPNPCVSARVRTDGSSGAKSLG
jgi:transposase